MLWSDVQKYFSEVIRQCRDQHGRGVGIVLGSFRFATMCLILGLDPEEGRERVLALARQEVRADSWPPDYRPGA